MTSARTTVCGLILSAIVALMSLAPGRAAAQEDQPNQAYQPTQPGQFRAIIPAFHDRLGSPGSESPLKLRTQAFVIFVFRNAVAVYCEAEFVNTSRDSVSQEFALPSTGHDRYSGEDNDLVSNGILSPWVWVEGERVGADVVQDDDGEWYAVQVPFQPDQVRELQALFWAQTSLADVDSLPGLDSTEIGPGPRGFLVDIAHAGVWNDVIDSIGVTVVLRGGLSFEADSFVVSPENYDIADSTISWSFQSVEPTTDNDIVFDYRPATPWPSGANTMARLSSYIVTKVYDQLLAYVRQTEDD
jgi:hypothetical protein